MNLLNHRETLHNSCTIITAALTDVWIQLRNPNSWIYVMSKTQTFNIICKGTTTALTLDGDGIVTLDEGCQLNREDMAISAHDVITTNLNRSFVPSLNLTRHISNPHLPEMRNTIVFDTQTYHQQNQELLHIKEALATLKDSEPPMTTNHKIHFSVTSAMILSCILFLIWKFIRGMKSRFTPTPAPRRQPEAHIIELTERTTSAQRGEHVQP